jgi:hypothetical protein
LRRTSASAASGTDSRDIARRARIPRHSSCPTVPNTKAAKENMSSAGIELVTPAASSPHSTTSAAVVGTAKVRRRFAGVARRQAIRGPMPDSSTSTSASGVT